MSGILGIMIGNSGSLDLNVKANLLNLNIVDYATSKGWNGTTPLKFKITIDSGVVIGSTSTSLYAIETGVLPAGSEIQIVNNGYIVGRGGNGANYYYPASAGYGGGPAIHAQAPLIITNNGVIGGGGGGGGYGQVNSGGGAGGGGAGWNPGDGAKDASGNLVGNNGTLTTGGAGITGGGAGGALGSAGGTGMNYGSTSRAGGAGGACVVGNSNITWIATGTRYGTIS